MIDRTDEFFDALESDTSEALKVLQNNKNEFKKQTDRLDYDNYEMNDSFDNFFMSDSKLKRTYSPILSNNNFETYSLMVLDDALNYAVHNLNLEVLDTMLENKNEFNIKNENIVQLLVEKVYDLKALSVDTGRKIEKLNENLSTVIEKLIEKDVSFVSDVHGYIPQVILLNKTENAEQLLKAVKENGSNINNFVQRYENQTNWLTKDEQEGFYKYDYNHDRSYNIYKKFDDTNKMSENSLDLCKSLSVVESKKLKM